MPTLSKITVIWNKEQVERSGEDFKTFTKDFKWNILVIKTGEHLQFTNDHLVNQTPIDLVTPFEVSPDDENIFDYEESRVTLSNNEDAKRFYVRIKPEKFVKQTGDHITIQLTFGFPALCIHAWDVTT